MGPGVGFDVAARAEGLEGAQSRSRLERARLEARLNHAEVCPAARVPMPRHQPRPLHAWCPVLLRTGAAGKRRAAEWALTLTLTLTPRPGRSKDPRCVFTVVLLSPKKENDTKSPEKRVSTLAEYSIVSQRFVRFASPTPLPKFALYLAHARLTHGLTPFACRLCVLNCVGVCACPCVPRASPLTYSRSRGQRNFYGDFF